MNAELLEFETVEEEIALLTFNRPEKLNALSTPLLEELDRRLEELERSSDVRILVLTGAGAKAFIAGADIGEYSGSGFPEFVRYQQFSRKIFTRLNRFPKPVIGAINGYALGGGFEIALCCDVLLASTNARFGLPEGLLGLSPGGGGTQRLTRAVGPYAAADVLLAANRLTAERALALGLVSEVVAPEELRESAIAKAKKMLSIAPLAALEMKRLVRSAGDVPQEAGLDLEQEVLFRLYHSEDAAEGIRAFMEKRSPVFKGE